VAWALWSVLLGHLPAAAADKLDLVQLNNGDRITCEIKQLDRSLLAVSTDPMGSVTVHWGDVVGLTSPRFFELQLTSGRHLFGSLASGPAGQLMVSLNGVTTTLPLAEVIRLIPIGASFWSRVDGGVDAGFSFAQANLETRWTFNGEATYRSQRYQLKTTLSSELIASEDSERTLRNSLSLYGNRSFANLWYTAGWGQFQQNEELSLDLRSVGGAGVGRDLAHTTRRLWSLYGGLAYTHEQFKDEPADQSIEAAVGGQLEFFSPDNNDFRITNSVISYYNISGRARARIELQSAWRHEFFSDFYWSLNGFESFDGDPPADQKQNDFGVSITLGWKF